MLLSKEQVEQVLKFHPKEYQSLIRSQIEIMDNIISLNMQKYQADKQYRDTMDQILGIIMKGNFAIYKEE